ncbi:MAG TPA: enterochelin esterase domain-containing protein, partial [Gemmatimonadaceae bacterium]|nr:enterochelin esterase domain-containing protein [Gemmatimonadaceae bacterium]
MRNHVFKFLLLAVCSFTGSLEAQTTLTLGDSASRKIEPKSTDSLFIVLRDGDYAKLIVSHETGLNVDVARPGGFRLGPFIDASEDGADPVTFAAEGAGKYAVVVTNMRETASQYAIAFKERLSLEERMRAVPWTDPQPSPTIERIRKAIEAGNANTAEFWKTIEKTGTPLVEPADSKYDLVTFLWRGENETRNVYVNASIGVPNGPNDLLHRLGETDIWYVTVKLPKGARFIYQLEPNRPPSPEMARVTRQVDPRNHGPKYSCPYETSTYQCYSIGELPEAVPQPWLAKRPGVATGSIEKKKIHSAIQKLDRELTVYLPAGYAPRGKPYDLVVLYDGEDFLEDAWRQNTFDNLIAAHRVPPFVGIMVHNV